MQPDILCLGEPLFEFNQMTKPSEQQYYLQGFGGDTSNASVAASRQGAKVGYITAVGQDAFGDAFMKLWQDEGINTQAVKRDDKAHTGIYFITHSEQGHAFTYFRKGSAASLMKPVDLPTQSIANAKILHVSGISQAISDDACDTVFAAINCAKANGVLVSYDTNLRLKLWDLERATAITHAAIKQADIALPSYEDATELTGLSAPNAIVDFYLALGCPNVVLKLGEKGAIVANPNERRAVLGHPVDAIDATGAGDTFAGSFLAEFVKNRDLFQAAKYANAAAALSTQGFGAVAPIPVRAKVEEFINQGS